MRTSVANTVTAAIRSALLGRARRRRAGGRGRTDPRPQRAAPVWFPARGWVGGRVQRELASNVDLVPTLVEVAGVPMRPTIQGHSLAGLFDGTPGPDRDRAFAEISYQDYYHLRRCIRTDRHKLIFLLHRGGDPHPADRRGGLVHDPVTPDRVANAFHPMAELFDLDGGPRGARQRDRRPAYRQVRDELLGRLDLWMRDAGDPLLDGAIAAPMHG